MADGPSIPSTANPLLVSVREAARLLAVSPNTVWSLLAKGKIKSVRLGRRTLVASAELHAFIGRLMADR